MLQQTALLLVVLFPFVGAGFAALMPRPAAARVWAVLVSALTLAVSIIVAVNVTPEAPVTWGYGAGKFLAVREIGFAFHLSCDAISMWLLLLTTLVTMLVLIAAGDRIAGDASAKNYYAWILVLLGALCGAFVAADGLLFYFFFEITLVPTLLLIGIWGGPERRAAAGRFFIYTFAGSVFLLIALIYLASKAGSFEITELVRVAQTGLSSRAHYLVCLGLLIGFLIKTPVFPLHTWQPLAYSQAPTGAAVLLAAVMSKLGTYGLLRFTLPMGFVNAPMNVNVLTAVIVLCLIGVIYGGLVAWVQRDLVKVIAYSSLSHLGVCVLAILAANTLSIQGAVMYMVSHGLSTAALLLTIGAIRDRTATQDIAELSGLFARMPVLSSLLVLFTMTSIGLPITSGFVGEFLSLQGIIQTFGLGVTAVASTGMILGAIYMLRMVARIGFGPLVMPAGSIVNDASRRELGALVPLALAVLALGIGPRPVLDSFKKDAQELAQGSKAGKIPVGFIRDHRLSDTVAINVSRGH
ncbi:MAG TPA: NADH-quinone oxidoreductase subunit M [Tepidisphaeraceae bacterium]|jgi:NADH-quinone oxidoreductase subunit M